MSETPTRICPHKTFSFRIHWGGKEIPAINHVAPLDKPGATTLTILRDHTEDTSCKEWMDSVIFHAMQPEGLEDISVISKDVRVEQLDEEGNITAAWTARRCRPAEHHLHPGPAGKPSDENSAERFVLLHDGLEREQ